MMFARTFAMPSANTFSIAPIGRFVRRYMLHSKCSVDPFARNNAWATYTNDLDPRTLADRHMDAEEFCIALQKEKVIADLALFDPPYSPRQISECYRGIGRSVTKADTQNARLYSRVRNALNLLIASGGCVLSFGWNTNGMGVKRGYRLVEVQAVAHGGAHNDTLCIAEEKL